MSTMKPQPSYRLHQSLGYQLSLTARVMERGFEESLREIGLSRISWCVLLAVGVEGLSKPSEIADFIGIDRTATSRALRSMEAEGMIARCCGKRDRRTKRVSLTARGCELLETAEPMARRNAARFAQKLTPEERALLTGLLKRLREGEDTPLPGL